MSDGQAGPTIDQPFRILLSSGITVNYNTMGQVFLIQAPGRLWNEVDMGQSSPVQEVQILVPAIGAMSLLKILDALRVEYEIPVPDGDPHPVKMN